MPQTTDILGVDAGGTFTDFVYYDGVTVKVHKVLSTPSNPADAILQGIKELDLGSRLDRLYVVHGSTVATNAALERKGVKTAYVTNKGFKDVLTIGRQARESLFDLTPEKVPPPVPEELCLEVSCRRDANGNVLTGLTPDDIESLIQQLKNLEPNAIAINLLFSFINDEEERQLEDALSKSYYVARSSFVLPQYKEYERGMATWLNASLGPKVQQYINELSEQLKGVSISIMQSSGGTMPVQQAAKRAVNLLLSGPAGGLAAVKALGNAIDEQNIISFDMGGTSTDVALMDVNFRLTQEGKINRWPVPVPMLDMQTIGAGGGSIAWLDEANLMHVGPQSAGSMPGPACYGLGGEAPTVTDANLVLGRLQADAFLGGAMILDRKKAELAVGALAMKAGMTMERCAEGIVQIAEQQMSQALHGISVQKGYQPERFLLCSFGGAGAMHVCALAEKMGIRNAIVPSNSGVLSAMGMVCAPRKRQYVKSRIGIWSDDALNAVARGFESLEQQAKDEFAEEKVQHSQITMRRTVDLRYLGQSYTLNVDFSKDSARAFGDLHETKYGHKLNADVELVNLCLSAEVGSDQGSLPDVDRPKEPKTCKVVSVYGEENLVPVINRSGLDCSDEIKGPAIITEKVATTWLKSGWQLTLDKLGNLCLKNNQ